MTIDGNEAVLEGNNGAKHSRATKQLELVGKSIRALHRVAITAANNYSSSKPTA